MIIPGSLTCWACFPPEIRRSRIVSIPAPDAPDQLLQDEKPGHAWTDGACFQQANDEIRHAGCGVLWYFGCTYNCMWPLGGLEQTSILAELNAVWFVIHYTSWPIVIHCDCQYVVDAVSYICENHRYESPFPDNFRILESIRANIHNLPGRITIVKVKGHAKFTPDVLAKCASGELDIVDILANHAVDLLAVEGSRMHNWDTCDTNRYVRDVKSGVNQLIKMLRIMRCRYAKLEELGIYTRDVQKPKRDSIKSVVAQDPGVFHGPSLDKHNIILPDGFDPRQKNLRWKNEPHVLFALTDYFNQIEVIPGLEIPVIAFTLDFWFDKGASFTTFSKNMKWSLQDGCHSAVNDLRCFYRNFGAPFRLDIKQRTAEQYTQYNLPCKGSVILNGWRLLHSVRVHEMLTSFTTLGDPFPSWFVQMNSFDISGNPPVHVRRAPHSGASAVVPPCARITETPSNRIRIAHGLGSDKRTQTADNNRINMITVHNLVNAPDKHIFETTWDESRAIRPFDDENPVIWFQHSVRIFCVKCHKGFSLNKLRSVFQDTCGNRVDSDIVVPVVFRNFGSARTRVAVDVRPTFSPCNDLRIKYGLPFDKRTETADHERIILIQEHNRNAIGTGLHVFPTSWDDASAFKAFTAADPNYWFQNSIRIHCSHCDFKTSLKCIRNAFLLPCSASHARASSSSGS